MNRNDRNRSGSRIAAILTIALIAVMSGATPVVASDYTLEIFGNANEDDTINMQDVTYTELIILEYRDRTELADAKYDGEIDILDMTQIALIILGREKELTILDSAGRIVTIKMPARVALGDIDAIEKFISYYLEWDYDKIVCICDATWYEFNGYSDYIGTLPYCCSAMYGEIDKDVVSKTEPDVFIVSYEFKNSLKADVAKKKYSVFVNEVDELGIPLFLANFSKPETPTLIKDYIMV